MMTMKMMSYRNTKLHEDNNCLYCFVVGDRPLLENVPGRSAILIHEGNYPKDTLGCILTGNNSVKGMVTKSKATLKKIMPMLEYYWKRNEEIWITIE